MSIPTQMSLVGFIASAPELHFTKAGAECCRMRVGIEQWRKEVDGRESTVIKEEFVARKIGHNANKTDYVVQRGRHAADRPLSAVPQPPAVGL